MLVENRALTLVLIASVVQVYLLSQFYFSHDSHILVELIIVLLVAFLPFALNRGKLKFVVELMAITAAVGGLGMVIGSLVDTWLSSSMQLPHHHHHATEATLLNWSNGFMLLFCFGACFMVCNKQFTTVKSKVTLHLLCTIAMFIGMVALSGLIANTFFYSLSAAAATHIAMLIGMQIGVSIPELIRIVFFQRDYRESCHTLKCKKRLY